MWQANALSDEFSLAKGWTKKKVDSLLNDLSNHCSVRMGRGNRLKIRSLVLSAPWKLMIISELRMNVLYLRGMTPEEVCVITWLKSR